MSESLTCRGWSEARLSSWCLSVLISFLILPSLREEDVVTARGRFSATCGDRKETEQGAFPVGPGVLARAAQAVSERGRVGGVCVVTSLRPRWMAGAGSELGDVLERCNLDFGAIV